MRTRRFVHTVSGGERDGRLDAVVRQWLAREVGSPLSKAAIRRLIMAGAVRLDGRAMRRPGALLAAGATLEAFLDLERLEDTERRRAGPDLRATPLAVLYEDDDLLAVAKPARMVTHATADPSRVDLFNAVRRTLASRAGTADLPYLGLHHRLDVDTSGVVLFTKSRRANPLLAAQFSAGEVAKIYHAIVQAPRGDAPRTWRTDNAIAQTGTGAGARVRPVKTGGARAITGFAILERLGPASLVEARPKTGRKHQIRAHLAGSQMPILGDLRYGGPATAGGCAASRVMLHARQLSLRHPITGRPLTIDCPYPDDFRRLVECLRAKTRG